MKKYLVFFGHHHHHNILSHELFITSTLPSNQSMFYWKSRTSVAGSKNTSDVLYKEAYSVNKQYQILEHSKITRMSICMHTSGNWKSLGNERAVVCCFPNSSCWKAAVPVHRTPAQSAQCQNVIPWGRQEALFATTYKEPMHSAFLPHVFSYNLVQRGKDLPKY